MQRITYVSRDTTMTRVLQVAYLMHEMLIQDFIFYNKRLLREILIGCFLHQGITRTAPAALALLQDTVFYQFPNIP